MCNERFDIFNPFSDEQTTVDVEYTISRDRSGIFAVELKELVSDTGVSLNYYLSEKFLEEIEDKLLLHAKDNHQ